MPIFRIHSYASRNRKAYRSYLFIQLQGLLHERIWIWHAKYRWARISFRCRIIFMPRINCMVVYTSYVLYLFSRIGKTDFRTIYRLRKIKNMRLTQTLLFSGWLSPLLCLMQYIFLPSCDAVFGFHIDDKLLELCFALGFGGGVHVPRNSLFVNRGGVSSLPAVRA